jgi:sirohydrochlorin ferrochelatase
MGDVRQDGVRSAPVSAPIVLAAHGSRDPASAATMIRLADRVGRVWPARVVAAFLDFDEPSIPDALLALGADPPPIVVPALLTHAYHSRADLPAVLASAGTPTRLADVLGPADAGVGPDPLLVGALCRRLSELDTSFDALVLLAAGTSHGPARSTVEAVAAELGQLLNVACRVGYASASAPTGGQAVAKLRAAGARRVVAASYFLAPGRLYSAAAASALASDARHVAAPLGTADELVRLIVARAIATGDAPATPVLVGSNASH